MTRVEGQDLQIEHQLDVIAPQQRQDRRGPLRIHLRRLRPFLLRFLDAPLHLPDGIEIVADLDLVRAIDLHLEPFDILRHGIQNAPVPPCIGAPLTGRPAFAEQPFEHRARIRLGRQRGRRRGPGQIVLVGARQPVVAMPDLRDQIRAQLERRQPRVPAHLLGRDLIRRRRQVVIAALGHLRRGAAQERRVRHRVIGAGRTIRLGQLQIRQDRQLIAKRQQRVQDGRQRGQASLSGGRPLRHDRPHRDEREHEAILARRQRRQGRHHRIQERQRRRHPHALQERPPREGLLRNDHCDLLI
jgi:hypothetical protein